MHRYSLIPTLLALLTSSNLNAGEIAGYNPANPVSHQTYDRFVSGYPSTVANPTVTVPNTSPLFLGNGYSNTLTGVGYLNDIPMFSVSLVSERHFIGAAHVGYAPGARINFVNAAGVLYTATVQTTRNPTTTFVNSSGAMQTLPSDVVVGTLTEPIPASAAIEHYRILKADVTVLPLVDVGGVQSGQPSPANFYDGRAMLNYGQNPAYGPSTHLGQNTLGSVQVASFGNLFQTEATVGAIYAYDPATAGSFYAIGGDSGGPSFLPYNGELTLLGAHYGNSGPVAPGAESVDSFLPFYTDQINAFMAMDTDATHPSGYSLELIVVPEPGLSLLLIGVAVGLSSLRAPRRRRTCRGLARWRSRRPC